MHLNEYYRDHRDEINSSIMEIASDLAVARMIEKHNQPFEHFVEPDIEEGEEADEDTPTRYKEEYQNEYNQFYDKEYARVAGVMRFDCCEEDGVTKQ
ncbi:MAG: hypothetical protein RR471_08065 [Bacteroides sp.]